MKKKISKKDAHPLGAYILMGDRCIVNSIQSSKKCSGKSKIKNKNKKERREGRANRMVCRLNWAIRRGPVEKRGRQASSIQSKAE